MTLAEQKQRRPRRIAADEAHAWARNLRLGNPYAKLVLSMLTIYVNGEGACFVSASALAEDCELALETVRRRLAWLETIGAITRLPQWIDENGRRNGDGRGRRTTDEIRLMIFAEPDEIEGKALGNDDHEGTTADPLPRGGSDHIAGPVHGEGANDTGTQAGPPATPSVRRGPESSEPEPEDSPPCPPSGGVMGPWDDGEEKTWPGGDTWPSFERAWQEPILRQSISRNVWSALTEDERRLAIRAGAGYVIWRSQQKKPPNVINAHTFLRERAAWPKFAGLAPPEPKAKVRVDVGTPAWIGLCVVKRIWRAAAPAGPVDIFEDAMRYLASLAPLHDLQGDWVLITEADHRHQVHAWQERLTKCGVRMPPTEKIATGETHAVLGPVWRYGWTVPCEWPPRMDGTLSTTGPPTQSLMNADDGRDLVERGP
jgi:hypothetical protein